MEITENNDTTYIIEAILLQNNNIIKLHETTHNNINWKIKINILRLLARTHNKPIH